MTDGLTYFKEVYQNVPDWVQIMHDYDPAMLNCYTDIRGQAFKDSPALSAREKDEFISSVNAGRLYGRSMLYHAAAGAIKGSTYCDLVEYYLVAYLYKGKAALELSLQALAQFVGEEVKAEYPTLSDVLEQIEAWSKEELPLVSGLKKLAGKGYDHTSPEVFSLLMGDGSVRSSRKYLNLVGQYVTELRGAEAKEAVEAALAHGVTLAELAELGYIVMITAGVPSWFELSDHLEKKEGQ